MSHFTVLVVLGKDPMPTTDEALERALQPFHEFECTGTRDEFVVFVDEQGRLEAEFNEPTEMFRDPADGSLYSPYDRIFMRPPTKAEKAKIGPAAGTGCAKGIVYDTYYLAYKERDDPDRILTLVCCDSFKDKLERVEVSGEEAHGPFADFCGRDGCEQHEGRWGRWTNPNAKWDWWVLGGRWPGSLKLKSGGSGRLGRRAGADHRDLPDEGADLAKIGHLDLDAMFADDFYTFAVLKDGQWHERGKMGWWANVSDEMDEGEWSQQFQGLLRDLHPDTVVAVVDCHI